MMDHEELHTEVATEKLGSPEIQDDFRDEIAIMINAIKELRKLGAL